MGCARSWATGHICRRRSACIATTNFLRKLGELTGLDAGAVHRAGEAHHDQAGVGSVAQSVTQDFFATASFARGGDRRPTTRGLVNFFQDELGLPCTFQFSRNAGAKPDNAAVREALRTTKKPLVLYGSYNERMYAAEARQPLRCTSRLPSRVR